MKKITTTMAVALMATMSVSAINTDSKPMLAGEVSFQPASLESFATVAQPVKAPMKIASVSELYGTFIMNGIGCLQNNGGQPVSTSLIFSEGTTDTQVSWAWGDWAEFALNAVVDLNASTIKFTRQTMGFSDRANTTLKFVIYKIEPDGDDHVKYTPVNDAEGVIGADKSITFPEDICLGIGNEDESGYNYLTRANVLSWPDYFTFNESEWELAGTAKYDDPWMKGALKPEFQPAAYDVPVYKNVDNAALYCFKNPYGEGTPYAGADLEGFNMTPNDAGYVVIDCSNPDIIFVRQYTYCGFTLDNGDGTTTPTYPFNLESDYKNQGWEDADIIDEFDYQELSVSCMEGNVLNLYNCFFGINVNPIGYYGWGGEASEGTITLDLGGVNDVEIDNSNAPVRYFNLQGVEVANPEQGQIVIKRQGTNSTKVIM